MSEQENDKKEYEAMAKIEEALSGLNTVSRIRVLQWATSRANEAHLGTFNDECGAIFGSPIPVPPRPPRPLRPV